MAVAPRSTVKGSAARSEPLARSNLPPVSPLNNTRPWWLWPNLLALDAPAVAVTWQLFLAAKAPVAVPLAASVVLALVVWGVYLTDRAVDAATGTTGSDR